MDEVQKQIEEEEEMRKLLERKLALEAENRRKLALIQQRATLPMPNSANSAATVQAKPMPISYEETLDRVDKFTTVDKILMHLKNTHPPRITTEMPTTFKLAALAYHPDKQGPVNDVEWTNFCQKLMQILIKVNRWDHTDKK
jgi:hypothetical protein